MDVVDFAYQVLEMHETIQRQNRELEDLRKYKQDYFDLINKNIKHNEEMSANMLSIFLTPGVTESFVKNGSVENFNKGK